MCTGRCVGPHLQACPINGAIPERHGGANLTQFHLNVLERTGALIATEQGMSWFTMVRCTFDTCVQRIVIYWLRAEIFVALHL